MSEHDGWMLFGGGWMWIFWIFLIAIVAVLVMSMGNIRGDSTRATSDDSPLSILKKRYAKGEINEEEFERKRKELED